MKFLPLLALSLFLMGCVGDRSDLDLFVTTTKAQHVAHIPPLKEPPRFEHFAYQAELMRSPFVPPSRELTEEVVDTSKSVSPKLKFEQEAAINFFQSILRKDDRALLVQFDSGVNLLQDFTNDPNKLGKQIMKLKAAGGTALYDAIYRICDEKMIQSR